MDDIVIEPLDRAKHRREGFCSGKPPLDDFLHNYAAQYDRRRLGRTFVALKPGESRILGYYSLSSGAIAWDELPSLLAKKLPKHPIPVILLGRLAVDQSMQGQSLGKRLLLDVFTRALELAQTLGIFAIAVDALDADAKSFYEKFGFVSLRTDERHLFLPLATLATASRR